MRVHILGGGIGGMSAALHLGRLVEDGALPADTEVTIYEAGDRLGGKASSQIPDVAGDGRWPGEHGFRFFPNFYRCIVETLRHIPITEAQVARRHLEPELAGKKVADLLKATTHAAVALDGNVHQISRAQSLEELPGVVRSLLAAFHVTPRDVAVFTSEITRFLLTCHERSLQTWEHRTLQDFLEDHEFSAAMETFLRSLRALSAMRADRASLRTLFFTAIQMLADFDDDNALWDALLPGPTDYLMLEPWEEELARLGVDVKRQHRVGAIEFAPGATGLPARVSRVRLHGAAPVEIVAQADDFFVLAIPYERARPILLAAPNLPTVFDGIRHVAQRADNLGDGAEPMVGIQFFLRRDVPITCGHVVYPKAEWAMTSISQAQFWTKTFADSLATVFDAPGLEGVLSVIVSAWDANAARIGKEPQHCTPAELAWEAFDQVCDGVGGQLTRGDVIGFHVDSDIRFSPGEAHCPTPLWVSPRGSFLDRPLADVGCQNLFIASDWARTETDVGSMESADEAARWAVRAIASRAPVPPSDGVLPEVRPLRLWPAVEVARKVDEWLFHHGFAHPLDLPPAARRLLATTLRAVRSGEDALQFVDAWSLVHLATDSNKTVPDPEPWMQVVSEGASHAELDEVIRVLDGVDASRWLDGADQGDPSVAVQELLTRMTTLR